MECPPKGAVEEETTPPRTVVGEGADRREAMMADRQPFVRVEDVDDAGYADLAVHVVLCHLPDSCRPGWWEAAKFEFTDRPSFLEAHAAGMRVGTELAAVLKIKLIEEVSGKALEGLQGRIGGGDGTTTEGSERLPDV